MGERMVPGSSVVISFQGVPVATQLASFYSSQVVSVTTVFGLPGTYTITLVSPLGTTSNGITLNVQAPPAPTVAPTPELQMIFPPSFDTTFLGNAWIMGDNFLPGATLVGTGPAGPIATPLLFVNTTTLGWDTATPLAGNYTVQVMNPDFQTSKAVSFTVGQIALTGGLPAPTLVYAPTSVTSPFFGTVRIFGSDFQLGASVELTDSQGNKTTTPVLFVASDEVWWELTYPKTGTYSALVRNADGQATTTWSFSVN